MLDTLIAAGECIAIAAGARRKFSTDGGGTRLDNWYMDPTRRR